MKGAEGGRSKPQAWADLGAVGSYVRLGELPSTLALGPTPWVGGGSTKLSLCPSRSLGLHLGLHGHNCLPVSWRLEDKVSQSLEVGAGGGGGGRGGA